MDTALFVTASNEHGADFIVAELNRRGVPLLRLNLDDEPVNLDVRLDDGGTWSGQIGQYGRSAQLRDVGAIWCRSIRRPAVDSSIVSSRAREWAAAQDQRALAAVLRCLPGPWINHPDRTRAASHKALQLSAAAELGFRVPRTLVTNSGDTAASWSAELGRPVLCKPFDPGGTIPHGWVPAAPITGPIPGGALGAQSIFQEIVYGTSMRVTVVGNRTFATRITPAPDDPSIDWRLGQAEADMQPAIIPEDVRERLAAFQLRFGLTYGAYDFIVTPDGTWWFLEINPVGQYGFVELRTGQPIAAAIADHLCPESASPDSTHQVMAS